MTSETSTKLDLKRPRDAAKVLGVDLPCVPKDAGRDEVCKILADWKKHTLKRAYRKMVFAHHPDKAQGNDPKSKQQDAAQRLVQTQVINSAYESLSKLGPKRRKVKERTDVSTMGMQPRPPSRTVHVVRRPPPYRPPPPPPCRPRFVIFDPCSGFYVVL